jgi:hypothetical protein
MSKPAIHFHTAKGCQALCKKKGNKKQFTEYWFEVTCGSCLKIKKSKNL